MYPQATSGATDAPAVGRLLHGFNTEYSEPTPGAEVLAERVARLLADDEMIVLLVDEGPDGLVQLRFRPSLWTGELDAHLEELYVVPARRGDGLGRALLDGAMSAAREAGATRMDLGTSDDDTAAIGLYEGAGFTDREGGPGGPRMRYYEREL